MLPGYHTVGLLQHDLTTAIEELAALGYRAVAVRPQRGQLAQADPWFGQQILRLADVTAKHQLELVFDLDSSFIHDPWKNRGPALASSNPDEAKLARDWIESWLKIAAEAKACLVTFASGQSDGSIGRDTESTLTCLAHELDHLVSTAHELEVTIALRPKHGDCISTVAQWERLQQWLNADVLGLAADIGEMLLGHEIPLADRLDRNREALACVYLCDRRTDQAVDQPIGQGDIAQDRLISSLREINFEGPVVVRIEGHSQQGLALAEQGMQLFKTP